MLFTIFLVAGIFLISMALSMVGLGGGLLYSPLFALLGFEKSMVVSTSLFLNLVAAASAATVYIRRKMVDFSVALPLLAAGLSAPLGALTTQRIGTELFILILGVVVFFGAVRMLFSPKKAVRTGETSLGARVAGSAGVGLAVGFVAGLVGIGGGVFIVPLLIYGLKVPTRTAAASNTFVVCFSSLTGFATHASLSAVNWSFILLAALFSFAGAQAGSRLMAARLQGRTVRIIFAAVLFLMSAKLFHRTLF